MSCLDIIVTLKDYCPFFVVLAFKVLKTYQYIIQAFLSDKLKIIVEIILRLIYRIMLASASSF